ncbi:hypothetical protein G6514_001043 [Epicoccum nigrum]|nr:hypothetical protein G6514_001043 [Epicoccum nigrum]
MELRKALGKRGLVVALPSQYEYLRQFDLQALEAQVDFFNVLTYDLYGPWDSTVLEPHTDL